MSNKDNSGQGQPAPLLDEPLTRREREVLALLAQGLSGPEIAEQLQLGLSSVRSHIQHAYGKLGVNARRQAVARARELGLLDDLSQTSTPALPAASVNGPKHNLPRQVTRFFGREHEIAQVVELIGEHPLVTLTGSGGVGKTRLSLEVAALALDDFADGVWLVELAVLSDPALVPQQVAAALGLRDEPGRPILETLTAFLSPREALLVLDNCEHLLEACSKLSDVLLRVCPKLRILASSREPLAAYGEGVFRVPSLSFPDSHAVFASDQMDQFAAVSLFVDRACLALPDYGLTPQNAAAITRVCQRLDGIPLALEMAAARVNLLNAHELAERLDDVFRLLTIGSRSALPRQQTLRATIDWSYQLLNQRERLMLRRLSVFAGGCTLAAAEAVCTGDSLDAGDILDVLGSLVAKSMVIASRGAGAMARYRLLETVRQYGREKALEAGEADMLRLRHLDYFLGLAEAAESQLKGPSQMVWLERLRAETDNLRAALALGGQYRASDEKCLRLVLALHWFWQIRIDVASGQARTWLEAALAQGIAAERGLSRAQALYTSASLARHHGQYPFPPAQFDESIEIFREVGSPGQRGLAYALCNRGKSLAQFEESMALFRKVGDNWGLAQALIRLADILNPYMNWPARRQGNPTGPAALPESAGPAWDDHTTEKALYEESLSLFRALGDRWAATMPMRGLGLVASWQGDAAASQALFEACLTVYRDFGDKLGAAACLERLGTNALAQGELDRASAFYEESLALFRSMERRVGIAQLHYSLAETARRRADFEQAALLFAESLTQYQRLGQAGDEENPLDGLGRVACSRRDFAQARSLQMQALAVRRLSGAPLSILQSLQSLAVLAAAQEQSERAARLFGAVEAFRQPLYYCYLSIWRAEHERSMAATRAELGEGEFARLFAEGEGMTFEQAVHYALGDNTE